MAVNEGVDRKIVTGNQSNKTILALLVYCVSGTLLTLVNKLAILAFPYSNMLLVLQNGATVMLLVSISHFSPQTFESIPSLNMAIVKMWMPVVLLFVVMLTSSLLSLLYVSVPTVIVIRNLSTLLVAVLEYIILSRKTNSLAIAILVGMLLGAIFYAKYDLTFSTLGYIWLCVNIAGTSIYQIYIKTIIDLPLMRDIGSIGMSYYNNLISLPVLLLLAIVMGELKTLLSRFDSISSLEMKSISVILLSCILGFSLSTSAFALNKRISATSIMVANNANKFFIIVLSEMFVQRTLDVVASTGALFVLFLGWLYSQSTKYFSKMVFILSAIIFAILIVTFEYKNLDTPINGVVGNSRASKMMDTFIINKFQKVIDREKTKGKEIYESYLPLTALSRRSHRFPSGIFIKNTTESQLPKICSNKNASIWKTCDPPRCKADSNILEWDYPRTTIRGENTGEFINRVLEVAWGPNPPTIDLYLRSGCNGIVEMKYLFKSIELFWPRFLGSVVIALDVGDEVILNQLLPSKPTHHYVIGFEHLPCLNPRIFNQYSYLNLDRHCTADYVVTIDSDCVFHTPVTPDLIFREGKVILASSRTFQGNMWASSIDHMMGVGMYDGHYMVTQPITFSLSTFSSFRQWFYKSKGICYEDRLSQVPARHHLNYCWMCQLGTYLERGHPKESEYKQYWFHHLDNATLEPLLRYSTHVTHEPHNVRPPIGNTEVYGKSGNEVVKQGLCRAFGSAVFQICANYSDFAYVNLVTFLYAHMEIQTANQTVRNYALSNYLKRLSRAIAIVLDRPTGLLPYL